MAYCKLIVWHFGINGLLLRFLVNISTVYCSGNIILTVQAKDQQQFRLDDVSDRHEAACCTFHSKTLPPLTQGTMDMSCVTRGVFNSDGVK